jgi:uncharacterized membrane protein
MRIESDDRAVRSEERSGRSSTGVRRPDLPPARCGVQAGAVVEQLVAVGAGLMGGVFVAFSVAVMPALRRRPAAEAVAVMQEVNRVIVSPLFLLVFLGTGVVGVVAAALDVRAAPGVALYVVGALGVTMAVNVPLNNRLDAEGEQVWARYLARWTAWNHVRALAATGSAVLLAW